MKTIHLFILLLLTIPFTACQEHPLKKEYPKSIGISIQETSAIEKQVLTLKISELTAKYPDFNEQAFVVLNDNTEAASQALDLNYDGTLDEIAFIYSTGKTEILYSPGEIKTREYESKSYAEISHKINGEFKKREYIGGEFKNTDYLKVPAEHTDHSWFIRYEGPGWESDNVGYRFYLDWRNAVDIFGKKTGEMVLHKVGLDGFDSYHEMSDWGMDILKVGGSLGLGSFGQWNAGKANRVEKTDSLQSRIIASGPIHSIVKTDYFGWKIEDKILDLNSYLSIDAHSRLTRSDLIFSEELSNICTGIVKHDSAKVLRSSAAADWQYLATYGPQSLNNDKLGMVVFYQKKDLIQLTEDAESHVLVLQPTENKVVYYFAAAWELEPGGISTEEQFENYLNNTLSELNNSVSIKVE
jgi:hypothetical protein